MRSSIGSISLTDRAAQTAPPAPRSMQQRDAGHAPRERALRPQHNSPLMRHLTRMALLCWRAAHRCAYAQAQMLPLSLGGGEPCAHRRAIYIILCLPVIRNGKIGSFPKKSHNFLAVSYKSSFKSRPRLSMNIFVGQQLFCSYLKNFTYFAVNTRHHAAILL